MSSWQIEIVHDSGVEQGGAVILDMDRPIVHVTAELPVGCWTSFIPEKHVAFFHPLFVFMFKLPGTYSINVRGCVLIRDLTILHRVGCKWHKYSIKILDPTTCLWKKSSVQSQCTKVKLWMSAAQSSILLNTCLTSQGTLRGMRSLIELAPGVYVKYGFMIIINTYNNYYQLFLRLGVSKAD